MEKEEIVIEESISQYVCFELADEEYAIDIKNIHEVIRVPIITPVPQMPDFVLGVVNIRGKVIPVFDLRKRFGLPQKEFDNQTKVLVGNVDGTYVSLVIDNILDNLNLDNKKIDPPPARKMNVDKECIKGVSVLDTRMLIILDFAKIHEDITKTINSYKG